MHAKHFLLQRCSTTVTNVFQKATVCRACLLDCLSTRSKPEDSSCSRARAQEDAGRMKLQRLISLDIDPVDAIVQPPRHMQPNCIIPFICICVREKRKTLLRENRYTSGLNSPYNTRGSRNSSITRHTIHAWRANTSRVTCTKRFQILSMLQWETWLLGYRLS